MKMNQQAGGSEAGSVTQRIDIITSYNTIYKTALQLRKDVCLGNSAYEDSWAAPSHPPPPQTWQSLCCSRGHGVSFSNQGLGLPSPCQSATKRSCMTVPLEASSGLFLLGSQQTLLNIHQIAASPSTTGQNQDIERKKQRQWAKFPIKAPNWTSGNYSIKPWVNQITLPAL